MLVPSIRLEYASEHLSAAPAGVIAMTTFWCACTHYPSHAAHGLLGRRHDEDPLDIDDDGERVGPADTPAFLGCRDLDLSRRQSLELDAPEVVLKVGHRHNPLGRGALFNARHERRYRRVCASLHDEQKVEEHVRHVEPRRTGVLHALAIIALRHVHRLQTVPNHQLVSGTGVIEHAAHCHKRLDAPIRQVRALPISLRIDVNVHREQHAISEVRRVDAPSLELA